MILDWGLVQDENCNFDNWFQSIVLRSWGGLEGILCNLD